MVKAAEQQISWHLPILDFCRGIRPRQVRTRLEFAEAEMILPSGPKRGLRFRCSYMPWTRLALEIMDSGVFRRFIASGPV